MRTPSEIASAREVARDTFRSLARYMERNLGLSAVDIDTALATALARRIAAHSKPGRAAAAAKAVAAYLVAAAEDHAMGETQGHG